MAVVHKIRVKHPADNPNGQIHHAMRETRIAAIKASGRLAPTARITFLYSMLYDPDSRIRALAQETLIAGAPADIEVFVAESGHPKVLDFVAHNLPKDTPILAAVARAPSLAKKTRDYLMSLTGASELKKSEERQPVARSVEAVVSKGESSEDSSLEWTPSEDVDLPDGVEFSMPTVDEAAPEDTVPVLSKKPVFPGFPIQTSEKTFNEPASPEELVEEKSLEAEIPIKTGDVSVAPSQDEVSETAGEAPEAGAVESAAVEETDREAPAYKMPVEEIPIRPKPFTVPLHSTRTPRSTQKTSQKGLFPVYEAEPEPAQPKVVPVKPVAAKKAIEVSPKKARGIKGELVRGILVGFLVGLALVAVYILVNRYLPNLPKKFGSLIKRTSVATQPQTETFPNGATDNQASSRYSVNLLLGSYTSAQSLKEAQKKAEDMGLTTRTTQKEQDDIVYSVITSATGTKQNALKVVNAIRSKGISASLGSESEGKWSILCGDFPSEEEAKKRATSLRTGGYPANVSQNTRERIVYALTVINVPEDRKREVVAKLRDAGLNAREVPSYGR